MLVLGDSQIVINRKRATGIEKSYPIDTMWICIQSLVKRFHSIKMYHILRDLNYEMDKQEKIGLHMKLGKANINRDYVDSGIPP